MKALSGDVLHDLGRTRSKSGDEQAARRAKGGSVSLSGGVFKPER